MKRSAVQFCSPAPKNRFDIVKAVFDLLSLPVAGYGERAAVKGNSAAFAVIIHLVVPYLAARHIEGSAFSGRGISAAAKIPGAEKGDRRNDRLSYVFVYRSFKEINDCKSAR